MTTNLQPILNGAATPFQGRFETNTTDGGLVPHFVIEIAGGNGSVVGQNNPLPTAVSAPIPAGGNAIGTFNVTPGALTNSTAVACSASANTATILVPYSATRKFVHIFNRTTGNETADVGSSNVTVNGGIPIAAAGGFSFLGAGAAGPIYGISPVASTPMSYVEG